MNKKEYSNLGFTLIELLAVIVILAIVALVVTPLVLNVIENARNKAILSSAYGIVDAARLNYIENKFAGNEIDLDNLINRIEIDGEKPTGDVRVNRLGEVSVALYYDSGQCFYKGFGDATIEVREYDEDTCIAEAVRELSVGGMMLPYALEGSSSYNANGKGGLYLDTLDDTYRYKGLDPNNYIRLYGVDGQNDGLYRIISIDSNGIKVISNNILGDQIWDKGYVKFENCTSEKCPRYDSAQTVNTYCYQTGVNYFGCNAWYNVGGTFTNGTKAGTVNADSTVLTALNAYYDEKLDGLNSSIISDAVWNIGGLQVDNNIETILNMESSNTWTGKIGLMNVSDYVRAQLPLDNDSCYNNSLDNAQCGVNNWLYDSYYGQWTMNVYKDRNSLGFVIANGTGEVMQLQVYANRSIRPVVVLSPSIVLNGSGTSSLPYTIDGSVPQALVADGVYSVGGKDIDYSLDSNMVFDLAGKGGLYLDALDNTYRYKGLNPDNYIRLYGDGTLDDGLFRIISFSNNGIKVISEDLILDQPWDIGNVAPASCDAESCPRYDSTQMINTYCYQGGATYFGCNAWYDVDGTYTNGSKVGTVNTDSTVLTALKSYYDEKLSGLSSIIVANNVWNIGGISPTNIQNTLNYEEANTWTGKIGLMSVSEYVRAQLPSNSSSCYNQVQKNIECKVNNWLHRRSVNQWTMSAYKDRNSLALVIEETGKVVDLHVFSERSIRPTIVLSSSITLSGDGTKISPYTISINN